MDNVGFRTLGGGAARDTRLGAGPHERHGDHDLAWGDGAWAGDVGFGCRDSRSKFYLARSGDAIRHRLVLSRRLSINAKSNLQERVSGFLSGSAEPEEVTPIALTTELLAA